jgi:hypothetical protein
VFGLPPTRRGDAGGHVAARVQAPTVIPCRLGGVGVAHGPLHLHQIMACLQHVAREGAAQVVRGEVLDPCGLDVGHEAVPERVWVQVVPGVEVVVLVHAAQQRPRLVSALTAYRLRQKRSGRSAACSFRSTIAAGSSPFRTCRDTRSAPGCDRPLPR